MPFEPLKFLINQVKTAVGNLTSLKTPQPDVVTALNAHTDQIGDLGPYNGLDSDSIVAALSAAQGKALNLAKPNYTSGTFTPHLYDYNTFVRNLPTASYIKIGKFVIMFALYDGIDMTGITTMMQIRNMPCSTVYGGSIYSANLSPDLGGQRVIQPTQTGVYIRPNVITSDFRNGVSGPGGFMLFGIDD